MLKAGIIFNNLIDLTGDEDYSKTQLIDKFGLNKLVGRLLNERIEEEVDIKHTSLYSDFMEISKKKVAQNDRFIEIYKINPEFGLELGSNIFLYHLIHKKEYFNLVPWYYADSKKYLGDTWWETDEEILHNLLNMNCIDFIKRYKGY